VGVAVAVVVAVVVVVVVAAAAAAAAGVVLLEAPVAAPRREVWAALERTSIPRLASND